MAAERTLYPSWSRSSTSLRVGIVRIWGLMCGCTAPESRLESDPDCEFGKQTTRPSQSHVIDVDKKLSCLNLEPRPTNYSYIIANMTLEYRFVGLFGGTGRYSACTASACLQMRASHSWTNHEPFLTWDDRMWTLFDSHSPATDIVVCVRRLQTVASAQQAVRWGCV